VVDVGAALSHRHVVQRVPALRQAREPETGDLLPRRTLAPRSFIGVDSANAGHERADGRLPTELSGPLRGAPARPPTDERLSDLDGGPLCFPIDVVHQVVSFECRPLRRLSEEQPARLNDPTIDPAHHLVRGPVIADRRLFPTHPNSPNITSEAPMISTFR
jgi:hypothetical protein